MKNVYKMITIQNITKCFNILIRIAFISVILLLIVPISVDGQDNGWYVYSKTNDVNQLVSDGNILWIASDEGLVKYDKVNKVPVVFSTLNSGIPSRIVKSIVSDGSGGIWGATYNGIFHFDGTNWMNYNQGNTPELKYFAAINIFRDSAGNIWITYPSGNSASSYVTMFDGSNWSSYNFVNEVYGISENNSGNVMIGSDDGYFIYNGTSWTHVTSADLGLSSTVSISILIQDAGDNYWLATKNSGLLKYDGINISTYNTSNSPLADNRLKEVKEDTSGNMWITFSTPVGFQKFDGVNWTLYNQNNSGITYNGVTDVLTDGTNLWVGIYGSSFGDGGLNLYNGTMWKDMFISNSGIPSDNLSSIALLNNGANGVIWVGTYSNGIVSFNGTTWDTYNTSNSGLSNDNVNDIAVDRSGKIWIATLNGLNVFVVGANMWTVYNSSNTGSNGLQSDIIDAIKIDTTGLVDTIWICNSNGVTKFDGTNWENFKPASNDIPEFTLIDIDKYHNIWLGSSYGIERFDGTNWTYWSHNNSNLQSDHIGDLKATSIGVVAAVGYSNGIAVFNPDSSDWINYDYTNSSLTFDWVQVICEIPDTTNYINTSFSLLKTNTNTSQPLKFSSNLLFGGGSLFSQVAGENNIIKSVRKTNQLELASLLLHFYSLIKADLYFQRALAFLIGQSVQIIMATSGGLAVKNNFQVPEDTTHKGLPKVDGVSINEVKLKHRNTDKGEMTQVTVTPGDKGGFLTIESVESDGTDPKKGCTSKVLVKNIYIPDKYTLSSTFKFNVTAGFYLSAGKTAIVNTFVSSIPPLSDEPDIGDLSSQYLNFVGLTYNNAIGAIPDSTLTYTYPGPEPNDQPVNHPPTIISHKDYPNIDLNASQYPPLGTYAGDLDACVPAGAANSLLWLNNTNHDFSLPEGTTPRKVLEDLSFFMNRKDSSGVNDENFIIGELDYIENYNLPLEVKFQSSQIKNKLVSSTNNNSAARNFNGKDNKPTWEFIKQQMKDNEDVEINYHWFTLDTNKSNGTVDTSWHGHCENIVGLREYEDHFKRLILQSDYNQEHPGGNETEYTGRVWKGSDGFLHFKSYGDIMKITGIIVESPLPKQGRESSVYLNEIYANNGGYANSVSGSLASTPEFVEVVVDTNITNLNNYRLSLYDSAGTVYDVKTLDQFTKGTSMDSMSVYYYNYTGGILNKGGVSLMYSGSPIPGQFVSYGSSFIADSGDATGLQSDSIGLSSPGVSISLQGSGINYNDFTWNSKDVPTPGDFNTGQNIITGIRNNKMIPLEYSLSQNYPNPFNPATKIRYTIPQNDHVTLNIYDILGRLVSTIVDEEQKAGIYIVNFDASYLASGVYFYRIQTGNFSNTKKLILIK